MFRQSDKNCTGPDAAPMEERNVPWKEKFDTLSQSASRKVKVLHTLDSHTFTTCIEHSHIEVSHVQICACMTGFTERLNCVNVILSFKSFFIKQFSNIL